MGFKFIRVAIFYAGLPKPNATLLLPSPDEKTLEGTASGLAA